MMAAVEEDAMRAMSAGGMQQRSSGHGFVPDLPDEAFDDDEEEEEDVADVIEAIKETSDKQKDQANSAFAAASPFGGLAEPIADDHALALAEEVAPIKGPAKQSSDGEKHLVETEKSQALQVFATIIALTGAGFAVWVNFTDQGQQLLRQFNKGNGYPEEKEREIALSRMSDRKLK